MTHWKSSLVLLPLLLLGKPAIALQIVDAHDGETVLGKLSRKEVTRIAFDHDRIRKITGNAAEFVLEKDDEKGQIFIRPADPESTKPINLFLSSTHTTIALLLQPVDTPSDTLMIRVPQARSASPSRLEWSGRHVRTLKNLLLALAGDALPDDMEAKAPQREIALWPGARLILQRVLLGAGVIGEKYQLTNTSTAPFEIVEPDLFKAGVMAVSVEHANLSPGEVTHLFVIRERRSDD